MMKPLTGGVDYQYSGREQGVNGKVSEKASVTAATGNGHCACTLDSVAYRQMM